VREYDLILFYQIGSYKTYIFVNTHAGSTPIGNRATYNDAVGFPSILAQRGPTAMPFP